MNNSGRINRSNIPPALRESRLTRPYDNNIQTKTMKTLHSLAVGLRPASSILARRIAFPLLLLGAGLVLVQPSAGQSGTWTETGSLAIARNCHDGDLACADGRGCSTTAPLRHGQGRCAVPVKATLL